MPPGVAARLARIASASLDPPCLLIRLNHTIGDRIARAGGMNTPLGEMFETFGEFFERLVESRERRRQFLKTFGGLPARRKEAPEARNAHPERRDHLPESEIGSATEVRQFPEGEKGFPETSARLCEHLAREGEPLTRECELLPREVKTLTRECGSLTRECERFTRLWLRFTRPYEWLTRPCARLTLACKSQKAQIWAGGRRFWPCEGRCPSRGAWQRPISALTSNIPAPGPRTTNPGLRKGRESA